MPPGDCSGSPGHGSIFRRVSVVSRMSDVSGHPARSAFMPRRPLIVATVLVLSAAARAQEAEPFSQPPISVPDGYTVELAAAPPLVKHPIMAGFDDRGRLYVAETAGINMQ